MIYKGKNTREISFPIGGIGTGSIGLGGNGRFLDWEIYNRPAKASDYYYTHFAVRADADGEILDTRVLQGDLVASFMGPTIKGDYIGYGTGPTFSTHAGMPHFEESEFVGEFPFATLNFKDSHFPGRVKLTAFNPFIPRNEDDSSIPAAFFEIEFTNYTERTLNYTACFSCMNPNPSKTVNSYSRDGDISKIYMTTQALTSDDIGYADMTIATDCPTLSYQEYWYRAGWKDDFLTYWRNLNEDIELKNRHYDDPDYKKKNYGDHATLAPRVTVAPGETKKVRFILAWSVPVNYNYWAPCKKKVGDKEVDVTWKNYYATVFPTSADSAQYALENWSRLYKETLRFKEELFSQTLPGKIIEAISSTICVLKSPTVWRLEDGSFYGWEGSQEIVGSCEGTCTHVWNYAYAMPFLFPRLERSIRDLDYTYNYKHAGKMEFRMALPLGREDYVPNHACVDGQMGGVFKTYREWKICGDDEWLKKNWEHVKGALEYAWHPDNEDHWDSNKDGVLEGRQHNTLDTEQFGASSWLEGYYILGLRAAAEMAEYLGEDDKAKEYRDLAEKGRAYLDKELFNGRYYYHNVDLNDYSVVEPYKDAADIWNEEVGEIKYQIGEGSEIDQVGAQWHSDILGLGQIFDPNQLKTALNFMYEHNFKKTMRNTYNPWRLFCIDDEAGAVICDYPEGARIPAIPLPYAQETMHGFEYMLAAQLIKSGMIDKGLEVIAGVRDRYDGEKRNPFNEIECGSNYARNMATFSYIPLFSGFIFDMPHKTIGFKPILKGHFKAIWSLDPAWGNVVVEDDSIMVTVIDGALALDKFVMPLTGVSSVKVDGVEINDYKVVDDTVVFGSTVTIKETLEVIA